MTASIMIAVADCSNALKLPNAALRYHLPGTPLLRSKQRGRKRFAKAIADSGGVSLPAPGQKWNPNETAFMTFDPVQNHPGRVYKGPDNKPVEKSVVLGLRTAP
jgi:hypothetical protein